MTGRGKKREKEGEYPNAVAMKGQQQGLPSHLTFCACLSITRFL